MKRKKEKASIFLLVAKRILSPKRRRPFSQSLASNSPFCFLEEQRARKDQLSRRRRRQEKPKKAEHECDSFSFFHFFFRRYLKDAGGGTGTRAASFPFVERRSASRRAAPGHLAVPLLRSGCTIRRAATVGPEGGTGAAREGAGAGGEKEFALLRRREREERSNQALGFLFLSIS